MCMVISMPSNTTLDILRNFSAPAVSAGLINQAELDSAFELLSAATTESKRERLITFRDAAQQLGISTRTVARMLHCGELTGKRLRPQHSQTMRVFQSSVDAILSPSPDRRAISNSTKKGESQL
jgi:excisionase family DNA binding protein